MPSFRRLMLSIHVPLVMFIATQTALLAADAEPTATSAAAQRPNIVIFLADDQGWGDLSCHGNTNIATPNIDSLATDGAIFDRFYACPVCAPTRAEMLTGRYHPRTGVRGVSTGQERMNVDEVTLADTLKKAGYATAAFGKWHNGTQWPYHPNARGFDEYYGFCSGHWGMYFDPMLEHNGQIVRGEGYLVDDLTNHAIDFIETNRDKPMLCYLPYNVPHTPFQMPDEYYDRFTDADITMRNRDPEKEELPRTRSALAMCENVDWNVGRVLKTLKQLGLTENTIVIYISDNGPNSWRWNDGMRGKKGSTDEGGVRVPCLIRWPKKITPGTRVDKIAGMIDLLPTLADLCDVPLISSKPLDGKSLKSLLVGDKKSTAQAATEWPDRMIFSCQSNKRVSVRTQQYRLDDAGRLYDMKADPGQSVEINQQKPDIAEKLATAVETWKSEALIKEAKDSRPFTVGYRERPMTMLPARDGVAHEGVERSGKAPNCSFFRNWTSTDDSITWDIAVATPGTYEAGVYYACPKKDVGSTVELSLGDAKIIAKVTDPHDPPLRGEEYDRVNRGSESYVKDFKPMSLGTFELPKGRGQLTLRALDIPGSQAMEVRMITLTLK